MDPRNRLNDNYADVNQRINRVRSRGERLTDEFVTLSHGAGGKASAALIDQVFVPGYGNEVLDDLGDAGVVSLKAMGLSGEGRLAISTDSYVVSPIKFPGGSIGDLAVNGTVNDLAVSGAIPKVISAGFILEEGLPIATLREIVADMQVAAEKAGVKIVAGDTKVVPRGAGDQVYINTAGVGVVPPERVLGASQVQVGDVVICSGPIADHGMAVLLARGDLAIDAPIQSDTKPVVELVDAVFEAAPNTRWMRDVTRGGLGTVLNELAKDTGLAVAIEDQKIEINDMTRAACDLLGIDPLYVANEGLFVAVVPPEQADGAVAALRETPGGERAGVIGKILTEPAASVMLVTGFGGTRMVDLLVGDPLPRIC